MFIAQPKQGYRKREVQISKENRLKIVYFAGHYTVSHIYSKFRDYLKYFPTASYWQLEVFTLICAVK